MAALEKCGRCEGAEELDVLPDDLTSHLLTTEAEASNLTEFAKGAAEAHEKAAEAASAQGPMEGATCYICMDEGSEDDPLLHGGCGCRGAAGFGHLKCLIESAKADATARRWSRCPTCEQHYTGPVQLGLAEARAAHAASQQLMDVEAIMDQAHAKLHNGDLPGAATLFRQVLSFFRLSLGPSAITNQNVLAVIMNLANALASQGEAYFPEAMSLEEEALAGAAEAQAQGATWAPDLSKQVRMSLAFSIPT